MLDLYKNIKKRRKELNISQQELAEAVGYKGKSMISQVEKGLVDLPESMIIKFADALHTTPYYLMGWEKVHTTVSGHGFDVVEVHVENTPDQETLNNNMMKRAIRLYDLYLQAPPEIQAAVETLLKVSKSDS